MHQKSERKVAHPWLIGRQRARQPDTPSDAQQPLSAARLALEAAFSSTPASREDVPQTADAKGPEVVIKRKKALASSSEAAAGTTSCETDAPERAPRIFRVETGISSAHGHAPALASAQPDVGPPVFGDTAFGTAASAGASEPVPSIPTRRQRRRAAPAVVTFVASRDDKSSAAVAGTAVEPEVEAAVLADRLAALEPEFSAIRRAQSFDLESAGERRSSLATSSGLPALLAEIERLKMLAEAAREQEAAQAVKWIKKAMAKYGLTARDVGL